MKRVILLAGVVILLWGCNANNKYHDIIKPDLVIENGAKLKKDAFFKKSNDPEVNKLIEEGTIKIDYHNNNYVDEVKEDKIVASNIVLFNSKDHKTNFNIDVKIKDTLKPQVKLVKDKIYLEKGKLIKEAEFINLLNIKVTDFSKYEIKIVDFDKIDFNKTQAKSVKVIIEDMAHNQVISNIMLYIENPSQIFSMKIPGQYSSYKDDCTFNLVIPSYLTTLYTDIKVTDTGTIDVAGDKSEYKILSLKNKNSSINIAFASYFIGSMPDSYEYFEVQNFRIASSINQGNYFTIFPKYNNGMISISSNNVKYATLKNYTIDILNSSYYQK
ncbi:MAG: hypothetical protein LBT75_05845 [Bacilli bacterium]|jgi:hypothetical protein|nr:hypothetical protein [Bacilli bacterium]